VAKERRARQKELEAAKKAAAKKAASRKELFRRVRVAVVMGLSVVVLLLILNALATQEVGQPARYAELRDQPTACGAEQPDEQTLDRWPEPADQNLDPGQPVLVSITTSCGDLQLDLDPSLAPASVNAFVFLARQGAYDGTVFEYVDPAFQIVGGDPEADGSGTFFMDGRRVTRPIGNEFPPEDFSMDRGVVALAGDISDRGSAFFIVTGDDVRLSNRFNVIGRIVDSEDTLDAISAVERSAPPGSGAATSPDETIYVESVTVDQETAG
jgi:cyclophilin family peptidyl-prolyl cis-trans isomerase